MADPRIGASHLDQVHASGTNIQSDWGAGGHCFVKDFAAFLNYARDCELDLASIDFLASAEAKNLSLLMLVVKMRKLSLASMGKVNLFYFHV